MFAAKKQDLVVGLCMHMELVPTPSPTPTPIPHPFVATISDPAAEAAVAVVAPMQAASGELAKDRPFSVDGMLCANVGVITKNASALPHVPLPPGTGWAPMPKPPKTPMGILEMPPPPDLPVCPAGDAVLHQGSGACNFGKGAIVRMGHQAQSCSEPARQVSTIISLGVRVLVSG